MHKIADKIKKEKGRVVSQPIADNPELIFGVIAEGEIFKTRAACLGPRVSVVGVVYFIYTDKLAG